MGQLQEACNGFVNEMVSNNIKQNAYPYNKLIDALGKEEGRKKPKMCVMVKDGVKPDIVTSKTLMNGYYIVNKMKTTKEEFNPMTQMG